PVGGHEESRQWRSAAPQWHRRQLRRPLCLEGRGDQQPGRAKFLCPKHRCGRPLGAAGQRQ
ncbi:MAG: hypothetical protein ACK56I_07180, partial [bacterium]